MIKIIDYIDCPGELTLEGIKSFVSNCRGPSFIRITQGPVPALVVWEGTMGGEHPTDEQLTAAYLQKRDASKDRFVRIKQIVDRWTEADLNTLPAMEEIRKVVNE